MKSKYWSVLKNHFSKTGPVMVLLFGAILFIFSKPIGELLDTLLHKISFLRKFEFTGPVSSLGSLVVISGVYGFMTRSEKFINYFGDIFHDILYDPKKIKSTEDVMNRWSILSNSLLEKKLPFNSNKLLSKIKNSFLDKEMEYGFRNVEVVLKIQKTDVENIVRIKHTFRADVVFRSDRDKFDINQRFRTDSEAFCFKSLIINNTELDVTKHSNKNDNGSMEVSYTVEKPSVHAIGQVGIIKFNRVYVYTTNIKEDPVISVSLERYVEGMSVLVKAVDVGYHFYKTGLNASKNKENFVDGNDYSVYIIGDTSSLLLPGEGFTLVITQGMNSKKIEQLGEN